ncbi:MAG TPA: hypothetical protein VHS54_01125 [Jatrophihabitans sp.]|nr:hypothetical protein [Jatrophihabitans sp.]
MTRGRIGVVLAAMAVLIVGLPAVSGADAYGLGVTTVPTTICGHNDHLLVHNPGAKFYQIRDAYWRGIGPTCIRSLGEVAGFRVTRTAKPLNGLSYPNIMRGCIWNICTPGDELPVKLSNLRSANSTWHTTERAGGGGTPRTTCGSTRTGSPAGTPAARS